MTRIASLALVTGSAQVLDPPDDTRTLRSAGASPALVPRTDTLPIAMRSDVVAARLRGRSLAQGLGFRVAEQAMITSAISELARNVLEHAGRGELLLGVCTDGSRRGLLIVARDRGPGIASPQTVLQAGPTCSKLGLPGVRVLMDHVEVVSARGVGTTITARKWRP